MIDKNISVAVFKTQQKIHLKIVSHLYIFDYHVHNIISIVLPNSHLDCELLNIIDIYDDQYERTEPRHLLAVVMHITV